MEPPPVSEPYAFLEGRFGRIGLVEMDTALAVHVHHHIHLVAKAGGADTVFQVRGRGYPVTDDHAVLVDAWEPHCWVPQFRGPGLAGPPTLFLTFYLEPDWVRDRLGFPSGGRFDLFAAPGTALDAAATRLIRCLADILFSTAPFGLDSRETGTVEDTVAALLSALVASRVARRSDHARSAIRARPQDPRIRRAFGMLRNGETLALDSLSLDRVAREVGLSRPHFFQLFHACTGVTPGSVANAARMERAIGLLTHSSEPLGGMAMDLGYASQGNFSRFFKQQIGICPNSYRRAAQRAGERSTP